MPATQLELDLWDNLEQATAAPEAADIAQLWGELEQFIAELPNELKLQTAGKAIEQIVEVFALRSDLILSVWEEVHNDEGPAVNEDVIAGLVRQAMTLDLSGLIEPPAPEHRQPRTQHALSVAGPVDKAALLEAFDSEIELVEAQAQAQSAVGAVAHDEDVSRWASAINLWLAEQTNSRSVFLAELQQGLNIPLVEVWLGLLLSQQPVYQLVQEGEFYDPQGVRVQIS